MKCYLLEPLLREFAPFYSNGEPCNVQQKYIDYLLRYNLIQRMGENKWARTILGDMLLRDPRIHSGGDFPTNCVLPKLEDLESKIALDYIPPNWPTPESLDAQEHWIQFLQKL